MTLVTPKVYLAARYSRKLEVAEVAALIKKVNIEVVSSWHDKPALNVDEAQIDLNKDFFFQEAQIDLDELEKANTLIFFSESPTTGIPRGGRHVEYGYFLRMRKDHPDMQIYIVGPTENIFNLFASERFADVPTFIYEMSKRIDL